MLAVKSKVQVLLQANQAGVLKVILEGVLTGFRADLNLPSAHQAPVCPMATPALAVVKTSQQYSTSVPDLTNALMDICNQILTAIIPKHLTSLMQSNHQSNIPASVSDLNDAGMASIKISQQCFSIST